MRQSFKCFNDRIVVGRVQECHFPINPDGNDPARTERATTQLDRGEQGRSGNRDEAYSRVDLVHGGVWFDACDLDDTATTSHGNQTRPVGRPRNTIHLDVVRQKYDKQTRTEWSHCTVYTFACVAMLMMQSDLSPPPIANKAPSGEIAHPFT